MKPLHLLLWLFAATLPLPAQATLHAADYPDLAAMNKACAAAGPQCLMVVSTPQEIALTQPETTTPGMHLRFDEGGLWTIDGASLTIGSGDVQGPAGSRIFAGSGSIRGLHSVRPEWFSGSREGVVPASALAEAYRATVAWGTIWLNDAVYISPFFDANKEDGCSQASTPYLSPRRFVGTSRPVVDNPSYPTLLTQGTVIRGSICGTAPLQLAHLGVDVGPLVVNQIYGGAQPHGIFLSNHGRLNPKHGTRLVDVSVLTNGADGQHSVLLEGEDGAQVNGLWIWTLGGTHGLIVKSSNVTVKDFHCRGASSDCLLIKSDYATAGNGLARNNTFDGVDIAFLARPGDTGGIVLDGRWDNVTTTVMDHVTEDGLTYGIETVGSWFYGVHGLRLDHWQALQMFGTCGRFSGARTVTLHVFTCERDTGPGSGMSLSGRGYTLSVGTLLCDNDCEAARQNAVEDSAYGTILQHVSATHFGGALVASARSGHDVRLDDVHLSGMGDRMITRLQPAPLSAGQRWAAIKPNLRILWQSTLTHIARLWNWVFHRSR